MRIWQKKSEHEEQNIAALQEKAAECVRQSNARIEKAVAELAKSQRDLDDKRNRPHGPDDSAGKARVCP